MGIEIHLSISDSVTQQEWEKVYEETLQLVQAFPFADLKRVLIKGIPVCCLVPTREQKEIGRWNHGKIDAGWSAVGDYETMMTAEDYYLPRNLVDDRKAAPDGKDALLGIICDDMDEDWDDSPYQKFYALWRNKTQGKTYHLYLLAIACLIQARLGKKAFVYGSITRGQCRKAVEMANEHLSTPIDLPDQCDMERFFRRVSDLPLSRKQQLTVFVKLYLGTQDAEFGTFLRRAYSEEVCDAYWQKVFQEFSFGTMGFEDSLSNYLLWGFDLEKLCQFVNEKGAEFVNRVMDAKLHIKDKDCSDVLQIDREESRPYSVVTLFAQLAFAGAKNRKVDRYISIEEIRKSLRKGLAGQCDTDTVIDEYLAAETEKPPIRIPKKGMSEEEIKDAYSQDAADVFSQIMELKRQELDDERQKYVIDAYEDLIYYKKGDTMHPDIMDSLCSMFVFFGSMLQEDAYRKLMSCSVKVRWEWLVEQNEHFLFRDKDWERIFTDIEEREEAYARYYPMMRADIKSEDHRFMVTAVALNDELYAYGKELAQTHQAR